MERGGLLERIRAERARLDEGHSGMTDADLAREWLGGHAERRTCIQTIEANTPPSTTPTTWRRCTIKAEPIGFSVHLHKGARPFRRVCEGCARYPDSGAES